MKRMMTFLGLILIAGGVLVLSLLMTGFIQFQKPYVMTLPPLTADKPLVIEHVNVLTMEREEVLADQTILIVDGKIAALAPADQVIVPANALVIDGRSKYLMPGLVDMHVHIKDPNELLLFLAAGVTGVRDMWGTEGWQTKVGFPSQLALQAAVAVGTVPGPHIYAAGPIMEGPPATMPLMPVFSDPAAAAADVVRQQQLGYQFIKVYDNLDPVTYQAIISQAQDLGLPVVGHVPRQVGLSTALDSGQQTIEHLTGYIDPDAAAFYFPEIELAAHAAHTVASGVWNVPTLGVYRKLVTGESLAALQNAPEMDYIAPRFHWLWRLFQSQMRAGLVYTGEDYAEQIIALQTKTMQALIVAEARFLLGTDTDNPYLVPGFSLQDEFILMVEAGLTPYQALEAGTRAAAEALGILAESGTVTLGKNADLVLLDANPLDAPENIKTVSGVVRAGLWLDHTQLQNWLDELHASYTPNWLGLIAAVILLGLGTASLIFRSRF